MQSSDKRFIFFVVFLILGIVLAVQFRSTLYAKRIKSQSELDLEELAAQIEEETKTSNMLKAQIDEVMTYNEILIKEYLADQNDDKLSIEWEKMRLLAGFTDVKGPGVIIKLDDATPGKTDIAASSLLVHDQDIKIILNELKAAGAQAISINGERITAVSEQVCAGPTILINKNRHSVPYEICAIGDPDALYDALANSEHVQFMIRDNIKVEIKKSKEVIVPRFSGKPENYLTGLEVLKDESE
ncbi:MAG TPA: DUF881 domain-containing protein [Clostridiaceae bacterium]|nr:DUF881 domain-containing protein [Clostridiaceae bacterium]